MMLKIIVSAIGGTILVVGLAFAMLFWWDAKTGVQVVEQSAVIERKVREAEEDESRIEQRRPLPRTSLRCRWVRAATCAR